MAALMGAYYKSDAHPRAFAAKPTSVGIFSTPLQAKQPREHQPQKYCWRLISLLPASRYFTKTAGLVQEYADYGRL
jgi:hypothetical protein